MRPEKAIVIGCLIIATAAEARVRSSTAGCLRVELESAHLVEPYVLEEAEFTAGRLFGNMGVSVRWTSAPRPVRGDCALVQAEFESNPPAATGSTVLANALPYADGGTQIHIFLSRVLHCPSGWQNGVFLGYVLAHEIGHVLERVNRHSEEGVMKASWNRMDLQQIFARSLGFAREDEILIQSGFSRGPELFQSGGISWPKDSLRSNSGALMCCPKLR